MNLPQKMLPHREFVDRVHTSFFFFFYQMHLTHLVLIDIMLNDFMLFFWNAFYTLRLDGDIAGIDLNSGEF
jgi:hypothetical protein